MYHFGPENVESNLFLSSFAVVVIVVVLCLQLWGREGGDSECFGCHS